VKEPRGSSGGQSKRSRRPATPFLSRTPASCSSTPATGTVAAGAGAALLTRSIFQTIADRTQTLLGVRLSAHKLRHTCASYLLMAGAQLETIQRHLGHQDVQTTMIYLHVPQRRQEEEIGRVFA
jgi:site-specific recombinase XerD